MWRCVSDVDYDLLGMTPPADSFDCIMKTVDDSLSVVGTASNLHVLNKLSCFGWLREVEYFSYVIAHISF